MEHVGLLRDVAGRLFHRDDVLNLREARQGRRLYVHSGAALHAIHDDRQSDRRGDSLVMLIETFLRGLVVVRRHGEDAVDPHVLQFERQFDDFLGVVPACAGHDRNASVRLFECDFDYAQMFGARECRALARGAAGHQKIDSRFDLASDQLAKRLLVE